MKKLKVKSWKQIYNSKYKKAGVCILLSGGKWILKHSTKQQNRNSPFSSEFYIFSVTLEFDVF